MTVTATAYTYEELSEDAKKVALDKSRNVTTEYFEWWDSDFDYWKEELAKLGYEVEDIFFTGFWSQGDGACFTGSLDVLKWLKATDGEDGADAKTRSLRYWLKKLGTEAAYVKFSHSGHYYHRFCMYIEAEWSEWTQPPKAVAQFEDLEKAILEDARDRALKIYQGLEKTHDAMSSDEYVADHITVNEFLFWETGSPAFFPR